MITGLKPQIVCSTSQRTSTVHPQVGNSQGNPSEPSSQSRMSLLGGPNFYIGHSQSNDECTPVSFTTPSFTRQNLPGHVGDGLYVGPLLLPRPRRSFAKSFSGARDSTGPKTTSSKQATHLFEPHSSDSEVDESHMEPDRLPCPM